MAGPDNQAKPIDRRDFATVLASQGVDFLISVEGKASPCFYFLDILFFILHAYYKTVLCN